MLVRQFGEFIVNDVAHYARKHVLGGGIHPRAEVFYVSAGQALLDWVGTTYQVEAPAILLIAPNTPHLFSRLSSTFRSWYIELELETADEKPSMEMITRWNTSQTLGNSQQLLYPLIDATLGSIYEALKQHWHTTQASIGKEILALDLRKLFLLIEEVFERSIESNSVATTKAEEAQKNCASQVQINHLIYYIESAYATNITLAELSALSGFTPAYIIKLFKASTGLTPIQYLQQLRLQAAVSYLNTTQLSVQKIAELCGFLSLHYFSRLFKQKFGESPSQWRKKTLLDKEASYTQGV